jgi:hypothetical protein
MTVMQLRSFLLQLAEQHFRLPYTVCFADEKRTKPKPPLVTLKLGSVTMSTHPIIEWKDGAVVKTHPSSVMLEINLYSPGVPVETASGVVPYQNSACDELTGYCLYLEYPATENVLFDAGVSILLNPPVRDVTAILDGVEPECRAMAEFTVDFVQTIADPKAYSGGGTGGAGGDDGEDGTTDATGYFTAVEIEEEETEA